MLRLVHNAAIVRSPQSGLKLADKPSSPNEPQEVPPQQNPPVEIPDGPKTPEYMPGQGEPQNVGESQK